MLMALGTRTRRACSLAQDWKKSPVIAPLWLSVVCGVDNQFFIRRLPSLLLLLVGLFDAIPNAVIVAYAAASGTQRVG